MKEFTIKNIFKCWLKLWPATVILIVAGAGIGVWQAKSLTQNYSTSARVLIVNNENVSQTADYPILANSVMVRGVAIDRAKLPQSCQASGAGAGNSVVISVACPTSEEDALKMLDSMVAVYNEKVKEIYGDKVDDIIILSGKPEVKTRVTSKTKLMKAAVPTAGGLLLSLAVAFIYTDYVTRKHGKKK